ncbi:Ribosomal protein L13 superfamily [Sesbania bispinosa]|nr:Ribosomal protein L13 superfamily [Sesbania bispinosa]
MKHNLILRSDNGVSSGICAKKVGVDACHHMLGHLVSIATKDNGQKMVLVRCEEICISGGRVRQKMKYITHGPIHFHAPAKIF